VFLDSDAGAYKLFVTVTMPQVIPGVADIAIRSESGDVDRVRTTVTTLSGAGAYLAPTPDTATQSPQDPKFFTSSLWLMMSGALRIVVLVDGAKGKAELSVPLPSYAQRTTVMDPVLGALLAILGLILSVSMVFIIRGAFLERDREPGEAIPAGNRRASKIAGAVTAGIVSLLLLGGWSWWGQEAQDYDAARKFYEPPKISVTLDGDRLRLKPADPDWSKAIKFDDLLPDHGHLMHLFLLRSPGMDRMWHLHPERKDNGEFEQKLPAVAAGNYRLFADVVDRKGFPWTMVGTVELPDLHGAPPLGDDSGASTAAISASQKDSTVFGLADGATMRWELDERPLRAGAPMLLKFVVLDRSGQPARDLEPYMGMAAHAEILRADFSVFAHLHPSGSVPMASMMLASEKIGVANAAELPMAGMLMPGERVPPEVSIPFGFPKPGPYRIFVQIRRGGHIQTAAFDAHVQ